MNIDFFAPNIIQGDYQNPFHDSLFHVASSLSELGNIYVRIGLPIKFEEEIADNLYIMPYDNLSRLEVNRDCICISVGFDTLPNWGYAGCKIAWGALPPYSDEADIYIAFSGYHRSVMELYGGISRDKISIIPLGVDSTLYSSSENLKLSDRFIYTAPAQNGLFRLYDIWPEICKIKPSAELLITSDASYLLSRKFDSFKIGEEARLVNSLINEFPNVTYKPQTGVEYISTIKDGGVMLYPCDPCSPSEMFGIDILRCLCAGTKVVCSDADALAECWHDLALVLPKNASAKTWADTSVGIANGLGGDYSDSLSNYNMDKIETSWNSLIGSCLEAT